MIPCLYRLESQPPGCRALTIYMYTNAILSSQVDVSSNNTKMLVHVAYVHMFMRCVGLSVPCCLQAGHPGLSLLQLSLQHNLTTALLLHLK